VPSTVLGEPAFPELLLVNPGSRDASVTLRHLPGGDGVAGEETEVAVPARAAVAVPRTFLAASSRAAVLATSEGGEIVVLGASASLGVQGFARYALVMGVPVPDGV